MNGNTSSNIDKAHVRSRVKSERSKMELDAALMRSEQIISRLRDFVEWDSVKSIHVYQPIKKYREVKTDILINFLHENHPTVKIASWRLHNSSCISWWLDDKDWQRPVEPGFKYDLIIIPLFAFNKSNHRIGYGGGFYDRFLKTQKNSITIGLCYEAGLYRDFQAEKHDVPLDLIVTEKIIYKIPEL